MSADAPLAARVLVQRGTDFTLDCSLGIAAGRTAALLGPSGAGKSTLVEAIAGLVPIDAGRIELGGRPLDAPQEGLFVAPERRRIGVVFQDYVLFPHLSVVQNVAFGLRAQGIPARAALARACDWLHRLALDGLADRKPRDLSGGQAQRVALARALIPEPELLLLDEPLSALDVTTRVELRRTLADHLQRFAGPRLLITHDPAEAFLLADEIHVIEHGRVTQVGTADDIRLRPRTRYAADLAGANWLLGTAAAGVVAVANHRLQVADAHIQGDVLLTIHPRAISLHRRLPEGSPRNAWETRVTRVEALGERVRLNVGDPLPLTVEVTPSAVQALGIEPGSGIWVSIKATEIGVQPD